MQKADNFRKKRLAEALLTHRTLGAAAAAAGVTPRTAYRWRKEEDFQTLLDVLQQDKLDGVATRAVAALDEALDVLQSVMTDATAPASVRLRAAVAVCDMALRLFELRSLTRRVEALELYQSRQDGAGAW